MPQPPHLTTFLNDPLWYKDAVIYELHVRAFYDSNADGMGDFRGLTEKLDYLEDLGVNTIWLLPFFPSPWRDDGYDISDFRQVHSAYGSLRDFQLFLKEAHRRGLRVITELVINHTSDQHAWFQRSRRAAPGSRWRDFYVWSDSPDKYAGTRIIFKDFEPSNWSWDPVAKSYFWHRFYSHQPDLNYDNPIVRRAVMRTLDFWCEMGVDGFRLDAIPYLYEREGTSCENLPETHAFLKELRQHLDSRYPNKLLLAEANMWPEDAVAYLQDGNECQMSFHFPLMPRMFMALRLEERLPIVEILKRTPKIPETCQWALFLRNHDELTLEMVTDEERDYMYRVYATDLRTRINLGIRRRLAPLLGNDRQRIELINGLLFSLPGTPVLYYGDEIGMGDNVYLGDRNGMRTPMQWSPDRNAGFSICNPQRLYLPVNIDPEYNYEWINVESQANNPHSLLNWTKRLVELRKEYKAFGRGSLEFLEPVNQRILAFLRRYQDETMLVVANLSRSAQPVELDLHRFRGMTPVEMFGLTEFPQIGESYYTLTLGPSSFFWFSLEPRNATTRLALSGIESDADATPVLDIPVLAMFWESTYRDQIAIVLARYLSAQSWFLGRDRQFRGSQIVDALPLVPNQPWRLVLTRIDYTQGDSQHYLLPLALMDSESLRNVQANHPEAIIAKVRSLEGSEHVLQDATLLPEFCSALLDVVSKRKRVAGEAGALTGHRNREFRAIWGASPPALAPVATLEESCASIYYGDRFLLKLFSNVEPGVHPRVEMGRVLTEVHRFSPAAPFTGWLEYRKNIGVDSSITFGVVEGLVQSSNDAWHFTRDHLSDFFQRVATEGTHEIAPEEVKVFSLENLQFQTPTTAKELIGDYLAFAELIGKRVGQLHQVLAAEYSDPAFAPEGFTDFYRQSLYQGLLGLTSRRFEFLRQRFAELPTMARHLASRVLELQPEVSEIFRKLYTGRLSAQRTRYHGRLHLNQILVTVDDLSITGFEGDQQEHLSERRIKRSPLRDVASLLCSFGYVLQGSILRHASGARNESTTRQALDSWGRFWYYHVSTAFLRGYWNTAERFSYLPESLRDQQQLLDIYLLERALLEIRSNLNERPQMTAVPLNIILYLAGRED